MPWQQWLNDLQNQRNQRKIIVRHDPLSDRYLRAQNRLFDVVRDADPIAYDDFTQKYNDWIGHHLVCKLVVWQRQAGWKFGVYAVFEMAYRQQDEAFLSGVLFAYYDGLGSDGGEKLRSLEAAKKYANKQGFTIIDGVE